ncbi:hypothetical protein ACN47E_004643 [Coniothyrium glycines]
MDPANDWIAQRVLLRTDYAMLALTSTVFIARIAVQFSRRRRFEVQDALLYVAFLAYLAFTILYIVITPIFYNLQALEGGQIAPWPRFAQDLKLASEVMWSSGMCYWTCLWFVKFSLLALYKKLLVGMPKLYVSIWWCTLVFCIVTWATCIITGPGLACDDTKAFLNQGQTCSSPAETRRQTVNLYYAYAVDVATNLMVMFLPLRLIWGLQMERNKKIGCGLLFASGFVCILFSTLRIVQVGGDGKPRSPDPKWLTMWTIIECSTAVIIGCCPVFASLIPKSRASRVSFNASGYVQQSAGRSNGTGSNNYRLRNMLRSKDRKKGPPSNSLGSNSMFAVGNNSEDELPPSRVNHTGIKLTPELRREHERRMAASQSDPV